MEGGDRVDRWEREGGEDGRKRELWTPKGLVCARSSVW